MFTCLVSVLLISQSALCLEPEEGQSAAGGTVALPWQNELCCDSAQLSAEEGRRTASNRTDAHHPHYTRCHYRSMTSHPQIDGGPSGDTCLRIMCRVDENREHLICDLKFHTLPSGTVQDGFLAISLRRLQTWEDDTAVMNESVWTASAVVCEGKDSVVCSLALGDNSSSVAAVTAGLSNATTPFVLLRIPDRPSPPVNLTHFQTIDGQLILQWSVSSRLAVSCEVRHSFNSTHPDWQVVPVPGGFSSVSLDLKAKLNYTVQARCVSTAQPAALWSEWSQPHHVYLHIVSYIPEKAVVRPGENITVYCVFNDHRTNANTAVWLRNMKDQLPHSQYSSVNQWVSQVTFAPSQKRMYDLLQCTQTWNLPYSQIYVEGAAIDISCETNGDIDAMTCSWEKVPWTTLNFLSRWADVPCEVMEERERAGIGGVVGEEVMVLVGGAGQAACPPGRPSDRLRSCTIQPLRMNCYKVWLEVPSELGPVRSRAVYVSPTDVVKPHPPSNIHAVRQASGTLRVSWQPPSLPVDGVQCQFRYYSPSSIKEWQVQSPTRASWAEVVVPDMCWLYLVQVRCMPNSGTGKWGDWSGSVNSRPSRAPEHGPDFWRAIQDDPYRNTTNVTLLFKHLPVEWHSYCVTGFEVHHQTTRGTVTTIQIELVPSYSFEWSQEVHTVTVGAYNNLGSSGNNINMTLDRQPKRHVVRSFHAAVSNSTCVCLSWSLLDNISVPLAMVVEWAPHSQRDIDSPSGETWARFPYTDRTVYLRGDFFGTEEYGFTLYSVFADGEGLPVYAIATRRSPAAYLLVITFLLIVVFATLILSQHRMKKFLWKDVPNPNHCSWAKGIDFKKADTIGHLFRHPEGLPVWPHPLPPETISEAVLVSLQGLTTALIQSPAVSPVPDVALTLPPGFTSGVPDGAPSIAFLKETSVPSCPSPGEALPADPGGPTESSAQSSVIYSTVLLSNPERDRSAGRRYKDSGSGSSDEGNFSANNSDISGSFPGGLWELGSCRGVEGDDPRHSGSYNSVEEFSDETQQEEQEEGGEEEEEEEEEEGSTMEGKGLCYHRVGESEGEGAREEATVMLLEDGFASRSDWGVETDLLLGPDGQLPRSAGGSPPLYLPQYKTAHTPSRKTASPNCELRS